MLTLEQLAEHVKGEWFGEPSTPLLAIASLAKAGVSDLAYYDNLRYLPLLKTTQAGAVLLTANHLSECPVNAIIVSDPYWAISEATRLLHSGKPKEALIHPTAQVSPTARLGKHVSIGQNSVIGDNVYLADGVTIAANAVVEAAVCIGENSYIGNQVSIHQGCRLGKDVVIDSGVVIGASPFNYTKHQRRWVPGPDVGGVVIGKGVRIGANTVIDRGSFADTYIGEQVCIDNLVQIAHDVIIGPYTAIAGCVAIGAYVQIGADCILGGASCIAASVQLADDVVITGMSTVAKSIQKPGVYSSGTMVSEHQRWRRNAARFRRLDDYVMRLYALEKKREQV